MLCTTVFKPSVALWSLLRRQICSAKPFHGFSANILVHDLPTSWHRLFDMRRICTAAAAAAMLTAATTTMSKCADDISTSEGDNAVVTKDNEYMEGIRIYGIGIKEDPVPGEKRGKGMQRLNSSYWMLALAVFIGLHPHPRCTHCLELIHPQHSVSQG